MAMQDLSWRPPARRAGRMRHNVGNPERWITGAAGAAMVAWAVERRTRDAWLWSVLGAGLLARATTGYCPAYAAAGLTTAGDTKQALSGPRGVHVEDSIIVRRPVSEVYAFWRNLENLPRVMEHLESVVDLDNQRSRWVAKAPLGMHVQWEAEIINEIRDRVIGWQSVEGSTVSTAGSVNFTELPGDAGTEVRVKLQYAPPGGRLGAWLASLFGEEPSQQVREDLRRFKSLMDDTSL